MDPFTMAAKLLGDIHLSPDQLAQLRAINTKYFAALAALHQDAAERDLPRLQAGAASDIREMLTDEQRAVCDRNLPSVIPARSEPADSSE